MKQRLLPAFPPMVISETPRFCPECVRQTLILLTHYNEIDQWLCLNPNCRIHFEAEAPC
jgi:hypothetical protein